MTVNLHIRESEVSDLSALEQLYPIERMKAERMQWQQVALWS